MATNFPITNGTAYLYGGQPSITGLEILTWDTGGAEKKAEDHVNAAGATIGELVKQICQKISFEARSKTLTDAQIIALFPEHRMCTVAGYTSYRVDSLQIAHSENAVKITGTLTLAFATSI